MTINYATEEEKFRNYFLPFPRTNSHTILSRYSYAYELSR